MGGPVNSLSPQVEAALDRICVLGCEVVSAYIAALAEGENRAEYAGLDAAERASLLAELRSIMSVYDSRD